MTVRKRIAASFLLPLRKTNVTGYIDTHSNNKRVTYGSSKLRLRPLHPIVGLEAISATSTAITPQHTTLQNRIAKI